MYIVFSADKGLICNASVGTHGAPEFEEQRHSAGARSGGLPRRRRRHTVYTRTDLPRFHCRADEPYSILSLTYGIINSMND